MFIAIYQFSVKPGHEHAFRQAWLALTQGIYLQRQPRLAPASGYGRAVYRLCAMAKLSRMGKRR